MSTSSKIKVMFIIARMNVGGPAVLVSDLMRNLNASEIEAKLITGFCDDSESDYLNEVATDINATRIPGLGRSVSLWKDLKAFFLVLREIRRFRPDVIHTHTAKAGVIGRIAGFIARPSAKRIHTFHGHLLHGYFGPKKVQAIVMLERALGLITFKFIAIGNTVKRDLIQVRIAKEDKFETIFPGLQKLDVYEQDVARKVLHLDPKKIYIVFVGRLTQIKRPDRLIDLARSLKMEKTSPHIVVAGAGEMLEELTELASRESLPITFLGWRSDIGMILSASDIAVLCSDNEGIPLTLIQASQAGLPIVSTNVGSVNDIVLDGITGLLTQVSSDDFIQKVSMLLNEPAIGARLGKAGQERARDMFSSKVMVRSHEELYSRSL